MARDVVAITPLVLNDSVAVPAGTTISPTNGAVITPAGKGNLVIHINNTTVSAKIVTISAGDNPPAFRGGLGDLAESIAASTEVLFVLETARFMQNDGTILVDFAASMTGSIKVYRTPGGF
jgi:hypothetical protein